MSTPQVKCPNCKTSMPYTAAACPNCKHRMVATPGNLNSGSGVKTVSSRSTMIGGLVAGVIILALILFCCSSGNKQPSYEDQRAIEMKPVRDEMQRKMNEGKTREQAGDYENYTMRHNLRQGFGGVSKTILFETNQSNIISCY